MIEITGRLPKVIVDTLAKLGVTVSDVQVIGDDIDVFLTTNGTPTSLYAIYVGDYKWLVDELDDPANLFPTLEEGDTISADAIAKLFTNTITSGLILSFNPLGRVKYGIKDVATKVGDTVKKVGKAVGDWTLDRVDADQAQTAIRNLGTVKTTYVDSRDGKTKKGNFSTAGVNVGKIESLGKMGHYKVLTGNPGTQDFQVFHLYRNGNKYRILDAKTGLEAEEAKWVYDNNLPKNYTEEDWKGGNEDFMNNIEEDNVQETQTTKETQVQEEDNVTEEPVEEIEEVEQTEEDNTDIIGDPDDWWDVENTGTTEEDNVTEVKQKIKQKQKVKSSLDEEEEDNVIESKPLRKKSKYNGKNVSGCVDADGTVALASWIKQNLMDFHNAMKKKDIKGKAEEQLNKVMKLIKDILSVNPKLASEMTKQSTDNLTIDFSVVPNANMKYVITLEFTEDGVQVSGSGLPKEDKLGFTLDCLNKVIKTIAGV